MKDIPGRIKLTHRNDGVTIDYQISTDGDTWHDIEVTEYFNFIEHGLEPSRVVFIRALLETTSGGDDNTDGIAPYIEKIEVTADMNLPTEMYARTKPYKPEKLGTILGASVWGRVFAPYTLGVASGIFTIVPVTNVSPGLIST